MDKHDSNPELLQPVQKDNELKEWFVNYVGKKLQPENDEVTMEMIIEVLSVEFPEILLVVAEAKLFKSLRFERRLFYKLAHVSFCPWCFSFYREL